MDRRDDKDLARLLVENHFRQIESAYNAGRISVHMLAGPVPAPGRLAEFHRISESYHSVEIAYGPWASSDDLLRVITWYDLPGQEGITPENYLGFRTEEAVAADAEVDGRRVTGTLGAAGESWVWSATVRESHLLVTGRGKKRHFSLTTTGDFAEVVANGMAFQQRGFR